MRWKLFCCVLLTSTVISSANERPKRSLGYFKNLLGTKLFGAPSTPTNSVLVAQLISKNDTHQLFNIPGQTYNLLIQVANKTKTGDKGLEAVKIVSPEIAILGTYLGTKTQGETLLAVDMAKSLIKSGVLQGYNDNFLQKLVVETKEKVVPLNIYTQEQDHLFILPGTNRVEVKNPAPIYPVELPPVRVPLPRYNVGQPPVALPLPPNYSVELPPVAVPLPPRYPMELPPVAVPLPPRYPMELPPVGVPIPPRYSVELPPVGMPLPSRYPIRLPPVEVNKPVPVYPVELPPVAVPLPSKYPMELPPLFVGPEIAVPFSSKYSYNQFGSNANTKYESYNGKEVIVTQTTKEPFIPDCLKYRIKEVAAIGVNPFVKVPVAPVPSMPINIAPIPYQGRPLPPTVSTVDQPFKVHINTQPILFSEPVPLQQVVNISPIKHAIIDTKGVVKVTSNAHSVNSNNGAVKLESDVDKVDIKYTNNKGMAVSNSVTGNVATSYVYKQVNSQNPALSTEIRIENKPNANAPASQMNNPDLSKNFVYVPPKDVSVPPPIGLSSQQNLKQSNDHPYTSKTVPYVPMSLSVKTNGSLASHPIIVVSDDVGVENRGANAVKHQNKQMEATRGDIPGSIH